MDTVQYKMAVLNSAVQEKGSEVLEKEQYMTWQYRKGQYSADQ